MVDTNEIAGWVSHCQNVAYLQTLLAHVQRRLEALGAVQAVRQPNPAPGPSDAAEVDPGSSGSQEQALRARALIDQLVTTAGTTPQTTGDHAITPAPAKPAETGVMA